MSRSRRGRFQSAPARDRDHICGGSRSQTEALLQLLDVGEPAMKRTSTSPPEEHLRHLRLRLRADACLATQCRADIAADLPGIVYESAGEEELFALENCPDDLLSRLAGTHDEGAER